MLTHCSTASSRRVLSQLMAQARRHAPLRATAQGTTQRRTSSTGLEGARRVAQRTTHSSTPTIPDFSQAIEQRAVYNNGRMLLLSGRRHLRMTAISPCRDKNEHDRKGDPCRRDWCDSCARRRYRERPGSATATHCLTRPFGVKTSEFGCLEDGAHAPGRRDLPWPPCRPPRAAAELVSASQGRICHRICRTGPQRRGA